jgi:flagellar motility protein MotE (MotC chaperone)
LAQQMFGFRHHRCGGRQKRRRRPRTTAGPKAAIRCRRRAAAGRLLAGRAPILERLLSGAMNWSSARDLDMRESLLKAAEKQLETRINELRELESRANSALQNKAESEAQSLKNLVTMYDNMKPKDAAKIFDRLDMRVLIEVASQINPRRMSDIMAQMTPEAAERLTIELAARAKEKGSGTELPKIEGQRAGN